MNIYTFTIEIIPNNPNGINTFNYGKKIVDIPAWNDCYNTARAIIEAKIYQWAKITKVTQTMKDDKPLFNYEHRIENGVPEFLA